MDTNKYCYFVEYIENGARNFAHWSRRTLAREILLNEVTIVRVVYKDFWDEL